MKQAFVIIMLTLILVASLSACNKVSDIAKTVDTPIVMSGDDIDISFPTETPTDEEVSLDEIPSMVEGLNEAREEAKAGLDEVAAMLEAVNASVFTDFDGTVVVGQRVLSALQAFDGQNVAILFFVGTEMYNYNAELDGFDATTGTVSDMLDFDNGIYKPKTFNIVDGNVQFNRPTKEGLESGKLGAVEVNPEGRYAAELYKGDTGEVYGIVFTLMP